MHREFRELIKVAVGVSEYIIAINLDIRNFSSFSKEVESPDVATFIKKVYTEIIEKYFPEASFFKPTGDGLIIIIIYTAKNLQEIIRKTIDSCDRVLEDFSSLCVKDPMINFEVPKRIGIGLARGTACRIASKDKTLDYSGRVLNLASRLMDLARPEGTVFDADFGIEILNDEQIEKFAKDSVYVRGIAEREPIDIYYTKELTIIPEWSRRPIQKVKWKRITETRTLKKIKDIGKIFFYDLPTEPADSNKINVKITHPHVIRGKKRKDFIYTFNLRDFKYYMEQDIYRVSVRYDKLAQEVESHGVKDNWPVRIEIAYVER